MQNINRYSSWYTTNVVGCGMPSALVYASNMKSAGHSAEYIRVDGRCNLSVDVDDDDKINKI